MGSARKAEREGEEGAELMQAPARGMRLLWTEGEGEKGVHVGS